MPCDYSQYPADWKERRARILTRAQHKCETCGAMNGDTMTLSGKPVVLTIAHLDRTGPPGPEDGPLDCPDDRLKALCQACHLRLDVKRHIAKAKATREQRRHAAFESAACGPLF